MALFPAWNGSQGARPPASFACQAFCFVAIRRKRQAVDRMRSAGGSSVAQSFALLWRHVASVLPAQSLRSACGSLCASLSSPPGRRFPPRLPGLGAASQSLMPRHFFANIASACRAQETRLSPKAWVFSTVWRPCCKRRSRPWRVVAKQQA